MKLHYTLLAVLSFLAGAAVGREVSVTVLYTGDLHGHIAGVSSEREVEPGGGLLRCASVIREIREQEPNVLLIDGGDLFQGSAESFLTRGDAVIDAVKTLRYDALVTGNHEFDWGITNLCRLYARAEIPVLAANITPARAGGDRRPWSPFLVKEFDGVRVVVVGLANPLTAFWIRPRLLGGLSFDPSVATLRRVLPAVREQHPDVLILAAHQGYRKWGSDAANEINAIARAFPEFDVILGGHTHEAVEGIDLNGVATLQPGSYGLWLAKIRLKVDTDLHRVTRRMAELIPVDSGVPPDPILERQCADILKQSRDYLDQDLGRAARELRAESRYPGQSQVQMLIARAIAEAVKAEVVFHGALTEASLREGKITQRDLWRLVPYENTIGVAQLTRNELQEILEENSRYLKSDQFRGVAGLTYELVKKGKDCTVQNIRLADGRELQAGLPAVATPAHIATQSVAGELQALQAGLPAVPSAQPMQAGERIRVAFNSYDLASAGGRFLRLRGIADRPSSRLEETDVDTRDAVMTYIRNHQPLDEKALEGARVVRKLRGQ